MLEVAAIRHLPGNRRPTMTEAYDGRQVVGMDLHRRRSVLVRMTMDGRKLETARIENSPAALRREIAKAGKNPLVVLEATCGWYWAADVLAEAGAEVHLAHPLGVRAFSYRRVKNDPGRGGPGGPAAGRAAARGVDRPGGRAGAAGGGPVPAQAGAAADQLQGPGARGTGQARCPGHALGCLRPRRRAVAGPAGPASPLCREGGLAARPDRGA